MIDAVADDGRTVLHMIAENPNLDVANLLLNAGADSNAKDSDGNSPLHVAARRNETEAIIETLIANGSVVDARGGSGHTPLHSAAAWNPTVAITETLIAAGANVQAITEHGLSPLHLAVRSNPNPDLVKVLIAAGANINPEDHWIASKPPPPLILAIQHNASQELIQCWWNMAPRFFGLALKATPRAIWLPRQRSNCCAGRRSIWL